MSDKLTGTRFNELFRSKHFVTRGSPRCCCNRKTTNI